MADAYQARFEKRIRRINKRHRKLARGYVAEVNGDGLIVVRPQRRTARFPWKGVALMFVALFAFKGILHAQLGAATFDERVGKLGNGTVVEKAGAWVMQADPVTLWVSSQVTPLVK